MDPDIVTLTLSAKPRVASLLPSATEIVALLGCTDHLVGISHECDYPPAVRRKPVITRARLADPGVSGDLDRDVRQRLNDALSIYTVDHEALRTAAPNLIITQDLCAVCAVSLDAVQAAVARLAQQDEITILSISPTRLDHVLTDIERVASALGIATRGQRATMALRRRIDTIAARAAQGLSRPRVVSIEWLDPLMLGGTWMPELIELAGGMAVGAKAGELAPTVTLDDVIALRPDRVLLKPCGFSIERTLQEHELLAQICRALDPNIPIYVADGNAYFNRSGPRLVDSLEILAACTHPTLFADFAARHQHGYRSIGNGRAAG